MYLSNIQLSDFRCFRKKDDGSPGLSVDFHPGLNIIVGENDSGKTAVIDAVRLLLGTVSDDFQPIEDDDFFCSTVGEYANSFHIQGLFKNLSVQEAGIFLEWISFNDQGEYELNVSLTVERRLNSNGQSYLDRTFVAGGVNAKSGMSSSAHSYLKAAYLKALRNASDELTPGFRSHLPKMLLAHSSFRNDPESESKLVGAMDTANKEIENFFAGKDSTSENNDDTDDGVQKSINGQLTNVLSKLYDQKDQSKSVTRFHLPQASLSQILKQLSLNPDSVNLGLGNMNLLFIATELALLNDHVMSIHHGPNITLVEELEAHLHVQAQIRLIKYIEEYIDTLENGVNVQFILTSHSVALTASVDQRFIIYLHNREAFPMGPTYTQLDEEGYTFLNRFLDATKCNLFFAKGLILVEGYSENILLPAIANLIDISLHRYGISIVNVGGRAFDNYVRLFSRKNSESLISVPISIIRDSDVRPFTYRINLQNKPSIGELIQDKTVFDGKELNKEYPTLNKLSKAYNLDFLDSKRKKIDELVRQNFTKEELAEWQTEKAQKLQDGFDNYNANTKVFVSPAWTLEYSLLFSPLRKLLVLAMIKAQRSRKTTPEEELSQFEEKFKKNSSDAVQSFFENFEKKKVSKSITAQYLAKEIANLSDEDRNKMKDELSKDCSYCNYLVEAIKFASGKTDGANNDE